MKKNLLLLSLLYASTFTDLLAAPPSYIQTKDGVIIFTDPIFTGSTKAVKLEVVSDNIIRVTAAPGKEIVAAQSLVTIYSKKSDLSWNVVSSKETLALKTKKLTAIVDLKTGAVTFRDANGKKILIEKLRYRLMPYIYSIAGAAYHDNYAIMRGLAMDFAKDASFNLYEDEGTNYNYERGDYAFIPIKYTEATKTIIVGDRKGSFDGMLSKRIFRINLLSPEHARNLDFDAKGDKEIFYEGKKIVIKLSSN